MVALILCILAWWSTRYAIRRSVATGLGVMFFWGYIYGIARANFLAPPAHFIFDASVVAFYFGYDWKLQADERPHVARVTKWLKILIGWAILISLVPLQTPMVEIVGLRGNIFFLPLLLVAARLSTKEARVLAYWIAALNLMALGFASGEYFLTVQRFFPDNAVTQIIYNSNDVAGYQYLRIPATFVTAHAFGGAMAASLPLLFAYWRSPRQPIWATVLCISGIVSALLGVLMSSTRVNFVFAAILICGVLLGGGVRGRSRLVLLVLIGVIGVVAVTNDRFSRFKSLSNEGAVMERVDGSVNRTFWEILEDYPLGNGMGGGGTSLPYFLQDQIRKPIAMESEYARILLEQGLPGLVLWIAFVGSIILGSRAFERSTWKPGRIVYWLYCCISFGSAAIGTGMMTAIPQSVFLMLYVGRILVAPPADIEGDDEVHLGDAGEMESEDRTDWVDAGQYARWGLNLG